MSRACAEAGIAFIGPPAEAIAVLEAANAKRPSDADVLAALVKQPLDPLSLDELDERVAVLEGEIARVNGKLSNEAFVAKAPPAAATMSRPRQ